MNKSRHKIYVQRNSGAKARLYSASLLSIQIYTWPSRGYREYITSLRRRYWLWLDTGYRVMFSVIAMFGLLCMIFPDLVSECTAESWLKFGPKSCGEVWELRGEPVPHNPVEADDQLLLLESEPPSSDIGSKIIYPSQPATLPAPL